MIVDSHCHLFFPKLRCELGEVLDRARSAGVGKVVTIGTDLEDSRWGAELAGQEEGVLAAAGIHPTSVVEAAHGDYIGELRQIASVHSVAAIGEIGFDFYHDPPDGMGWGEYKERQEVAFRAQMDLAAELGLNVVIHTRNSFDETAAVVAEYAGRVRTVFHCYSGTLAQARELIDAGHLVSFTGIVTFKNAREVQETAAALPAGSFLVETDAPFLAPTPHRGKRCEPAYTRLTADFIANLRGVALGQISEETTAAAADFFRGLTE